MITQSINLNLIPGAVPPRIKVSQYDYGSRTLQFTLYNGTTTFTQAGLSARIQGTKPDGKGFSYDATYGSGIVTADITRQMTACAGAVTCELVIVNEELDEELGTGNFILDVEAAALSEDTDISETEIPAIIDAAEANAERAEAAAESAEAASAHAPYIGENEHWYVWDSDDEQYVDSGVDAKGDDGATIVSVEKTSTSGYIDTYTITMSDGSTSTFTVTNGTSTLPGGGTKGQVLTKKSGTTGDVDWSSDLEEGMEGLINSTVGWTGKNKFDYARATCSGSEKTFPCVINGLTFTKNADSSITVTGEASATTQLFLWVNNTIPAGNYTISGCPSGGGTNKYDLRDGSAHIETGDGYDVNIASDVHAGDAYYLIITIYSGYNITDSLVFSPMIRDARITDPTYEPYHKSVEECLEELDAKIQTISISDYLDMQTGYAILATDSVIQKVGNVMHVKLHVYASEGTIPTSETKIATLKTTYNPKNETFLRGNTGVANYILDGIGYGNINPSNRQLHMKCVSTAKQYALLETIYEI